MDVLLVAIAALLGSLGSLLGGIYLLYGGKYTHRILRYAVPFAAGALLSAAFIDLLPEALENAKSEESIFIWALCGIILFFVLERGLRWFHHHHTHEDSSDNANRYLIIIGDTLHNVLDGLAIGAAFLVNPATGITATIAVAAHEIPQEIGDFALLLKKGMSRRAVLSVNILSALATTIAAVLVYSLGSAVSLPVGIILAVTAGFFIYIAASDIIPTIHAERDVRRANLQTVSLLLGVLLVGLITTFAHGYTNELEKDNHNHQRHALIDAMK